MEAKYYVPEIEEISVGFECEMHSTITQSFCRTATAEWTKLVVHPTDFLHALLYAIKAKKIRVKHLDREDIEFEGWRFGYSSWDRQTHERIVVVSEPFFEETLHYEFAINEQDVWQLVFTPSENHVKIVHAVLSENEMGLMSGGETIVEPKKYMTFNVKFDGTILNKSELRKIMKQLNINQK